MTVIADENPGIVLFFPVRAAKEASILQQAKADMALMLSLSRLSPTLAPTVWCL
jgi:hypothetical protein